MISTEQVKGLRDRTGISVMQCNSALKEADGDMDKALEILKAKGADIVSKKGGRSLGSGTIATYIHGGGAIGVIMELACETDFVARNEDFKALAHDIAMHIAATNPDYLNTENAEADEKSLGVQPERILLEQSFVKDESQKIKDLLTSAVQKFGERIEIARYERFSI
ncbi:elongation factor Ts [bacterium]|nr:elongation factor Ts [bacterium]|tara:strand:- start:23853 stop:24353 length:501 start_codon:yes stop_codon:yes gene_type:complete